MKTLVKEAYLEQLNSYPNQSKPKGPEFEAFDAAGEQNFHRTTLVTALMETTALNVLHELLEETK